MARGQSARRGALAAAFAGAAAYAAGSAFVSVAAARRQGGAVAAASAAGLAAAAPAFAEESASKVELGGGFALNLDIPETGIVNIVVLIAGLVYLLGPLLSESMSTREKEIQTDIDDAIAKYNEASSRLAEAQKSQAQANEVVAEIQASIEKDQKEFEANIRSTTNAVLEKQALVAESVLKDLETSASGNVETYINSEAIKRGHKELCSPSKDFQQKYLDAMIAGL